MNKRIRNLLAVLAAIVSGYIATVGLLALLIRIPVLANFKNLDVYCVIFGIMIGYFVSFLICRKKR